VILRPRRAIREFTVRDLSDLNICFVAGTLRQGGAERQLFYILQALCQRGASPRLLSLDQGGFWEEPIRALGVSVTWIGHQRSRLVRLLRVLKEVWRHRPDVLQSQHFYTNAYAGLAARLSRLGGIGAMRSNGRSEVKGSGPLGWLNLHLPRTIAANSQLAIRYAVAHHVPAVRLYFLPNVVDTQLFQMAEGKGARTAEPLTLIAVGRLSKEKRLDRFISILHRLRNDRGLNVRGLIVGSGYQHQDLRPELENQARSLGLFPDFLEFRGGVSDVHSVYHDAAICVLTSDFEGTPNVLLEAMACGLPVVSTNVGGIPDIVQDGRTGFVVKPENRDGLASAIVELVKSRELRIEMGRRARAFVEENHSLACLPAHLSRLYNLALSAERDRPAPVVKAYRFN
jgi:glycosyltransferase involved in cell wall biosynthesis